MRQIVGGVVRYRDLVAKIKIAKFFSCVFVGDSRKFVLAKISRYTVGRRVYKAPGRAALAQPLGRSYKVQLTVN